MSTWGLEASRLVGTTVARQMPSRVDCLIGDPLYTAARDWRDALYLAALLSLCVCGVGAAAAKVEGEEGMISEHMPGTELEQTPAAANPLDSYLPGVALATLVTLAFMGVWCT